MKTHLLVGILLVGLLAGAAQAQWLEKTIYLVPRCLVWAG